MLDFFTHLSPEVQQILMIVIGAILKHFYDKLGGKPAPPPPVPTPAPVPAPVPAQPIKAEAILDVGGAVSGNPIVAALLHVVADLIRKQAPVVGEEKKTNG